MAFPVPTVVGTETETASDGSIAIPNTTPPAVGDYLVAFIGAYAAGSSRSIGTAPSGFTKLQERTGDEETCALYVKRAVQADVDATNFTFTITGGVADVFAGALLKVTNVPTGSEVAGSEIDTVESDDSTLSYTTDLTPDTAESIILAMYMSANTGGGASTTGSYASTPSLSWTELADIGGSNSTVHMGFGIAFAEISGLTNITARSATVSEDAADGSDSIALILNAVTDDSATLGTITIGVTQNAVGVTGDANVTLGQIAIGAAPQALTPATPTPKWSNTDKSDESTFTNKPKS